MIGFCDVVEFVKTVFICPKYFSNLILNLNKLY